MPALADGVRARRLIAALTMAAVPVVGLLAVAAPASAQPDTVYRFGGYRGAAATVTAAVKSPTVVPGLSDVIALAAGNVTSYALEADGEEFAWGNGAEGQLGNGTRTHYISTPVQVDFPGSTVITAIAEANGYAVSVDSTGRAWAWGNTAPADANCLGKVENKTVPHLVPGVSGVESVAGASGHILFLTNSGEVYGCNKGAGRPYLVGGLPAPVAAVSAGDSFSSVLLADGEVWNWGDGQFGQLGDGSFSYSSVPVQVDLPAGTYATQIYAGGDDAANAHEVALLNTGAVVAWGENGSMQLGNGSHVNSDVPVYVNVPAGVSVTYVAAGGSTSYLVDANGDLWSWGDDNLGQAGTGNTHANVYPPAMVDTGVTLLSTTAANMVDYHG